jgi:hypothetical protein
MIALQLPLIAGELPFDPRELAGLAAPTRGRLYDELALDLSQRQAAEEAVRAVLRGDYREARR